MALPDHAPFPAAVHEGPGPGLTVATDGSGEAAPAVALQPLRHPRLPRIDVDVRGRPLHRLPRQVRCPHLRKILCIHPIPSEEYRSIISYESVYFKSGLDTSLRANPGFGDKVIDEVAAYIAEANPGVKGFNRRGLYRMK